MAGGSSTKVVQITNIAPQATKDQLQALFGLLGKIEEIRLCKLLTRVTSALKAGATYDLGSSEKPEAIELQFSDV